MATLNKQEWQVLYQFFGDEPQGLTNLNRLVVQ
jgi:hypothetical protein